MAVTTTTLMRNNRKKQSAAAQMKADMKQEATATATAPAPAPTTAPAPEAPKQGQLSLAATQAVVQGAQAAAQPAPAQAPKPAPAPAKVPEGVDAMLFGILSKCRAHGSYSEMVFRNWLHATLKDISGKIPGADFHVHTFGNVSLTIPKKDKLPSKVLFSCHIDTVDPSDSEKQPLPNKSLEYDANLEHLFLAKNSAGFSLGADDGIGVWLMLKMIYAGVPGTYLFHRGEECGCQGSRELAIKEADWLRQHKIAIAFDRPDNWEVITHQRGGTRGASDECGKAIAEHLNKFDMKYELSSKGVVTDTAQYFGLIPECLNLGVGYSGQHTTREQLDVGHVRKLLKALVAMPWEDLPVVRDPKKVETKPATVYNGYRGREFDDEFDTGYRSGYQSGVYGGTNGNHPVFKPQAQPLKTKAVEPEEPDWRYSDAEELMSYAADAVDEVRAMSLDELHDMVYDEPAKAFEALFGFLMEDEAKGAKVMKLAGMLNRTLR